MRFSTSGFFRESVSPKPLSIPLGSFRIFSKIRGDIRSSRFATGVSDTGGKCKKSRDTVPLSMFQNFEIVVKNLNI
jgi:hypothetical protein